MPRSNCSNWDKHNASGLELSLLVGGAYKLISANTVRVKCNPPIFGRQLSNQEGADGSWMTRTILIGNLRELSSSSAAAALLEQLRKGIQHGGYRNAAGAIGVASAVFPQAW
jgi:hypothetical protein